ncbi:hypothetical protein NOCD_11095 [Nocardioides cavernae]|uniref:hypothetical protein n=1 Tax=Nocardioides TaxID=1839 RepID=UPI0012E3E39B|nr:MULTISPECIES: hypothetical protein [Nocardioides]MCK9824030.1 hypothetical protein [Nocardioides cavernae]
MNQERIRGKVARVNSDRELIINRGAADGVTEGTFFYVRDEPVVITDPDSGESLGEVLPIKIVVRADEVDEKFCIARTFRSRRVLVREAEPGNDQFGAVLKSWRAQLQPPRPAEYETRVETLRVDPTKGSPIDDRDSIVRVGDVVESVLAGEDIDPVTTTLFK